MLSSLADDFRALTVIFFTVLRFRLGLHRVRRGHRFGSVAGVASGLVGRFQGADGQGAAGARLGRSPGRRQRRRVRGIGAAGVATLAQLRASRLRHRERRLRLGLGPTPAAALDAQQRLHGHGLHRRCCQQGPARLPKMPLFFLLISISFDRVSSMQPGFAGVGFFRCSRD